MASLKYCILASSICIVLLPASPAQEKKPVPEKAAPILRQLADWQSVLAAQESLSLVATESGRLEPDFDPDVPREFTATFKLSYKGKRFLYTYDFYGPKGLISGADESFDGERYARLDHRGRTLSICSKRFVNDIVMCQGHIFFLPFLFLQSGTRKDAFYQLTYEHLTSKDDWANALASFSTPSVVEEVEVEGRPYLKATNLGESVDSYTKETSVFDVYFDKATNGYPMKWERRSPTGVPVSSYTVEELGYIKLGSGETIPYPKIAVRKHFKDGKLRDTERIEMKEIGFNSVSDDIFSIDPASANSIVDGDKGVRIKVPK